jgi:hypothetical protein
MRLFFSFFLLMVLAVNSKANSVLWRVRRCCAVRDHTSSCTTENAVSPDFAAATDYIDGKGDDVKRSSPQCRLFNK